MTLQPTLPPDWAPRHYRPEDEQGVLQVLQDAFGGWPTLEIAVPAIDHLRWKMESHPDARRLNIVGEIDGRIVAWQCYWLLRLQAGSQQLLAKESVDSCVHPDFQRLGIRTKCWQLATTTSRRNFQVLFGPASGHPAMLRVEDKLGRPGRRLLANRVQALVWREYASDSRFTTAPAGGSGWSTRTATRFDDRFDAFFGEAAKPFDAIIARDSAFLNWRYADPRAGHFVVKLAEHDGHVLGYVVTRQPQRGRGCIADVLALPDRIDVAAALLSEAVAWLVAAGASKIESWLPQHHPYQPLFAGLGFQPRRRAVPFGLRPAQEYDATLDMGFAADPTAAIHISLGDTDLV